MYTIINKTQKTNIHIEGNWPNDLLNMLLNNGDKLIVISTYSDTIKIPFSTELNGIIEWNYDEYDLPSKLTQL